MASRSESSCRVVIVDDHATFADTVARSLNEEIGIEVVGTATNRLDGAELVRTMKPDVVLVDHRLGGANGLDLVRDLHATLPKVRLLMLTATIDEAVAFEAIEAGCIGYLGKDAPLEEVIEAVKAAAHGEAAIGAAMLTRMLMRLGSGDAPIGSRLTNRELEILQLIARGKSNAVIAEELFVSVNTVRNHVQNLLTKLGAHSKLEAVARAVDEGLVMLPSQLSRR